MLALVFALPAMAEESPITHTYLTSTEGGEYVFESVITPPGTLSTFTEYNAIIAMYDSRNALCGLAIEENLIAQNGISNSFQISTTPEKKPEKIKLMIWSTENPLIPLYQYEWVPTTVCDKDFGTTAYIQLTNIKSRSYTFEAIFNSPVNATYTPVIRMYDTYGNICGFYEAPDITLSANKQESQTYTVYNITGAKPAKIYFTLRNGTDIGQLSTISPEVAVEKYGIIMEADPANGVKLYATDGTYNYYDFADNFILSYGNTVVTNKDTAYNYLNTLRLKSYNRTADLDTNGDNRNDSWKEHYNWLLFFNHEERYGQIIPSSYYPTVMDDSARLDYTDFLNNYSKRMVRISVSPDGKINAMSFPGDSFFAKLTAGNAYSEVFYDTPNSRFSNKLNVKTDAKILYLPTKKNASESDFKVFTPAELKDGNSYYVKEYTTSNNQQIILVTYMLSEQEIATLNDKAIKNISLALNGNGGTAPGIKNHMFSITLPNQSIENNDRANALANTAMDYVAAGLEGALSDAQNGYCITKDYIKTKYSSEISAAKEAIYELQDMDKQYKAAYYNELQNEISTVVEGNALVFLKEYFLD